MWATILPLYFLFLRKLEVVDTCFCEDLIPASGNVLGDIFPFLLDFSFVRIGFAIQDMRVGWGCA
jgi:hypothetical protein